MKKIPFIVLSILFLLSFILPVSLVEADVLPPDYSSEEISNISTDQGDIEIEELGEDGIDGFLEELDAYPYGSIASEDLDSAKEDLANIFAVILVLLLPVLVVVLISIYVYTSLAYMTIAKKTGTRPAWLAWIPIANLYLVSKMARMHWWPMLLILTMIIPIVGIFAIVALSVYIFIWHWKIFERMERPGWWALTLLISGIGMIVFYVFLGMTAWAKPNRDQSIDKINPSSDQN